MLKIQSFSIKGLHGYRNISASFQDSQAILIGDNGVGKSTFLQMLFYTLSRNWSRLAEMDFADLTLKYQGGALILSKDDVISLSPDSDMSRELMDRFPTVFRKRIALAIRDLDITNGLGEISSIDCAKIADLARVPIVAVKDYIRIFNSREVSSNTKVSIEKFESLIDFEVLYFPTYRKVETDLSTLLKGAPSEIIDRTKRFIDRRSDGEILGFGMEDVKHMLDGKTNELSRDFNESMTSLMSGFLVKIINGEHRQNKRIEKISQYELMKVLSRTGTSIIPSKTRIKIENLAKKPASKMDEDDLIILYFVEQMIDVYNLQTKREEGLNSFAEKCNKYLSGKKVYFNTTAFTVEIRTDVKQDLLIDWQNLSSGEKQIASIFSRLYLNEAQCMILIDEPELSLSIEWQQMLLPDIVDAKNCIGVVAVTHSPFIFDNSLDRYASDFKISIYKGNNHGER